MYEDSKGVEKHKIPAEERAKFSRILSLASISVSILPLPKSIFPLLLMHWCTHKYEATYLNTINERNREVEVPSFWRCSIWWVVHCNGYLSLIYFCKLLDKYSRFLSPCPSPFPTRTLDALFGESLLPNFPWVRLNELEIFTSISSRDMKIDHLFEKDKTGNEEKQIPGKPLRGYSLWKFLSLSQENSIATYSFLVWMES